MAVTRTRLSLPGWGRRRSPKGNPGEIATDPAFSSADALGMLAEPAAPADAADKARPSRRKSTPTGDGVSPSRPRRRSPRPRVIVTPEQTDERVETRPLRILVVDDVDDVAAHLRELLRASPSTKLLGVVRDGRKAVDQVRELQPDIVIVDMLLKGRTKGITIARQIRKARLPAGVVALTVPDVAVDDPARNGVDAVVTLPVTTYELGRAMDGALSALRARDPARGNRVVAVFGPKGGVGRTTIAFNLAASLADTGLRTALVDGSLQYADVRRLLRVPPVAPSLCDLPTDAVRGSDLADNVLTDPSGIDVLLAPPRPEMAELITAHDLEAIVDLLRRTYQAVVIDTPAALAEPTLALLDSSDMILHVVTPETGSIDASRAALDAFDAMGYSASKVRVVVNRADTRGGMTRAQISRALGRPPDAELPSDWQLVTSANAEGVPFVRERPDAPIAEAMRALAHDVANVVGEDAAPVPVRIRRRRGN